MADLERLLWNPARTEDKRSNGGRMEREPSRAHMKGQGRTNLPLPCFPTAILLSRLTGLGPQQTPPGLSSSGHLGNLTK